LKSKLVTAGAGEVKAVLEVRDLTYQYRFGGLMSKKGKSIGPLNFTLPSGLCLGIIGESGSGKSTLAQLLVGLLTPSHGKLILDQLEIDFQRPKDLKRLRSNVQLVMQDGRGSLHPHFTIRQLLHEVLNLIKSKADTGKATQSILLDVGLTNQVLDRKPGSLSGGECLRVSIARALLLEPKVLICDESTSALDPATRDSLIELLQELMISKSLAVIFISHDEYLVKRMSNQLLVMSEGKVVEQGPTKDLVSNPTHEVTKKILAPYATLRGGKSSLS